LLAALRQLTFLDTEADMQHATSAAIIINCPPAEVFARLTNFDTWPQWGGGNLVSMQQVSAGPLQVGSQLRQVNQTGRRPTEKLVQVTDFVPDRTFGIERPNLRGTFTLEPVKTGTQLNAVFEVNAAGLSALMYRMFIKRFVTNDLRKFKALIEGR
jgi:uncharacterized protein YndB with AHSA1/START domain